MNLGRRYAHDPKDAGYPMAAVLPYAAVPDYRYWSGWRTHLNQTGDSCVANGWTHFICDSPRSHLLSDVDTDAPKWIGTWHSNYLSPQSSENGFRGWLYDQAQLIDEFSDTPPEGGTSVRAGAKVLQRIGALESYHWATSITDVTTAILTTGPVIVGTNWYEGFDNPSATTSLIKISGSVRGGHCYKLDGYNQKTQLFRMKNSWGTGWGDNGYAHISRADMDRLLFQEQGEACIGLEP